LVVLVNGDPEVERDAGHPARGEVGGNDDVDPAAGILSPVVTLEDVQRILLDSPATREQLSEHPMIDGAWLVEDESGNKIAGTFDRIVLDENSPEVRLLSYGDPLFDLVLMRAGVGSNLVGKGTVETIAEQIGELSFGDKL
jgi:hypothetical protein